MYDRQGWCPGEYSLLKEYDITSYATPGSTVTLDYNCSNPMIPTGDYRYIAAHQLISYGPPNFSLDVKLLDIKKPDNKVVYSRENPMCTKPVIIVQNTGSTTVTSIDIDYWMNNSAVKENFVWTGSLAFLDTVTINLPLGTLWQNGLAASNNKFNVELKKANNSIDNYSYNNKISNPFTLPDILTDSITIVTKTNNIPSENSYKLYDAGGALVPGASVFTTANTIYNDNYVLNGCYRMVFEDTGEDGLSWWASTAQGNGYVQFKNAQGVVIKTFNADFGKRFEYNFSTKPYPIPTLLQQNVALKGISIYPNPAQDKFEIYMPDTENAKITITDMMGRTFDLPHTTTKEKLVYDSSSLKAGVYLVRIVKENQTSVKKIVIE